MVPRQNVQKSSENSAQYREKHVYAALDDSKRTYRGYDVYTYKQLSKLDVHNNIFHKTFWTVTYNFVANYKAVILIQYLTCNTIYNISAPAKAMLKGESGTKMASGTYMNIQNGHISSTFSIFHYYNIILI